MSAIHYQYTVQTLDIESAQFRVSLTRYDRDKGETTPIFEMPSIDEMENPIRDYLHPSVQNSSYEQDQPFLQPGRFNPLDAASIQSYFQNTLHIIESHSSFGMNDSEYGYSINLDERGEFDADVRDLADHSVFRIPSLDRLEDARDEGIMRNANDIDGLEHHLKELGVIERDARIQPLSQFESHQKDVIADGEAITELASMRNAIFQAQDEVQSENITVTSDHRDPWNPTILFYDFSISASDDDSLLMTLEGESAQHILMRADKYSQEAVIPYPDALEAAVQPELETIGMRAEINTTPNN